LVAVSGIETAYLLLSTDQRKSVATLNLCCIVVALCVNSILIILIATRIWYLSPRQSRDILGVHLPEGTGQTAFAITIECGMLCFTTLVVYCVLFSIHSPAQAIIKGIAVQIYVRIRHLDGNLLWTQYRNLISQGIAPTLIYIRLSGLLNTQSLVQISSGYRPRTVSTSRSKLTKMGFGRSITASTDLALSAKVPKFETDSGCKPSSGDMGSNLSFVDCDNTV
jgi:hypothetical protein